MLWLPCKEAKVPLDNQVPTDKLAFDIPKIQINLHLP